MAQKILIWLGLAALLFTGSSVANGQAQGGRGNTALKRGLTDGGIADFWIYDDLARGLKEAEKTGKPLLVIIRCVP